MEIPARRLPGLRGERPIERVCIRAYDGRLREQGERHVIIHSAEFRDLLVRARLLAAEIVRRKPEHNESFVAIAAV